MPIIASFFAALLPMLIYLIIIWRMDKYEREPILFVLVHFAWGALGAIVLGVIGSFMLNDISGVSEEDGSIVQIVLFAPIAEEIAKGVFLLFTVNSKKFDNATDGLVYGGAIGLGFGMTENFTYFITYGSSPIGWLFLVVVRSGFSAVMHCISTATFGAFLGMAKFSLIRFSFILPIIGLFLAMFYHFLWNLSVSYAETFLYGFIFMIFLIVLFIVVFKIALKNEKKMIFRELVEEAELIPKHHVQIIGSHLRLRKGWIDERIRREYFRAAIKLAFAKMKSKKSNGFFKQQFLMEADRSREFIKSLFASIGNSE